MGGAYGGAFAAGLVNSLNQAQDRQINKAYRDALIQQTKSQVKMMEAQEQLKNIELMTKGAAIAEMTGQPLDSILSSMPRPQPVAEQRPQSLIGRLIQGITGGQPPQPQPQPQVAPPGAQPGLPQMIAQTQVQGMMPGARPAATPEEAARRKDIADKILYGVQPWREREAVQSQYAGPKVTVMTPQGPATIILNKRGESMNAYSLPPEYGTLQSKGMQGEDYTTFYNKNMPPGVNQPIMTAPPPQMVPKGMSSDVTEKVNKLEQFKSQLEGLKQMGQDPKVFGLWANTMAKAADTPLGAIAPADPNVLAFHKAMKRIENAQVHEFGGSNLTAQELQRALAGLPRAWNQQDFNTGVDALIKGTDNDIKNYYQTYSQSEAQRGAQTLGPRPQLPQQNRPQQTQAIPPPPSGWRIIQGEKSPDGYPIVTDGKVKKRWGP